MDKLVIIKKRFNSYYIVKIKKANHMILMYAKTLKSELIIIDKPCNIGKKTLYYASNIFFNSLFRVDKKNKYDEIPNLIVINISNHNININNFTISQYFKNKNAYMKYMTYINERCYSIYELRNTDSNKPEIFNKMLTFHFFELPKFKEN